MTQKQILAGPGGEFARRFGPLALADSQASTGYTTDWSGRYSGECLAIVSPRTLEDVVDLLQHCSREGIAVVTQGGNTGLVGGGTPAEGEVLLSTRRLRQPVVVDPEQGTVTAEAGVTIQEVMDQAEKQQLRLGIDLASRSSATVGGVVATNAGGLRVVRFGHVRQQLLGVQAVLGDGTVVSQLTGLRKDNTGYDMAGLLCGSEGTLGVVTRAILQLHPRPASTTVALLGFPTATAAFAALGTLRQCVPGLEALEFMTRSGIALVVEQLGLPVPGRQIDEAYLLLECTGAAGEELESLQHCATGLETSTVAVATTASERRRLWAYRERHTEAIARLGLAHKLDVAVPQAHLATFCRRATTDLEAAFPGAATFLFGHAADGNIHVNVVGPPADRWQVTDTIFRLVVELGGTISAEHGMGVAKRPWMRLVRDPATLDAYRRIKRALDPHDIMNPRVSPGTAVECLLQAHGDAHLRAVARQQGLARTV